jgi:DNA-binding transcriptional LysR family regulator
MAARSSPMHHVEIDASELQLGEARRAGPAESVGGQAAVAACVARQDLFQGLAMGLEPWLASGELMVILRDWSDERYPLYAYHPSRHLLPAKVRAFLDFVQEHARVTEGGLGRSRNPPHWVQP